MEGLSLEETLPKIWKKDVKKYGERLDKGKKEKNRRRWRKTISRKMEEKWRRDRKGGKKNQGHSFALYPVFFLFPLPHLLPPPPQPPYPTPLALGTTAIRIIITVGWNWVLTCNCFTFTFSSFASLSVCRGLSVFLCLFVSFGHFVSLHLSLTPPPLSSLSSSVSFILYLPVSLSLCLFLLSLHPLSLLSIIQTHTQSDSQCSEG